MNDLTWIAILLLTLAPLGERIWRARLLRQEAEQTTERTLLAEAEAKRLRRLLDQAVARDNQTADAADAERSRLLAQLCDLAESLDQGAHTVAAGRIRRFAHDRTRPGAGPDHTTPAPDRAGRRTQ